MPFGHEKYDVFVSNSVLKLCDENKIKNAFSANPKIKQILKDYGLKCNLNMAELNNLMQNHAKETEKYAIEITNHLPSNFKKLVNISDLRQGALLHDFGKVLIPSEILNKPSDLTPQESEIVHLHSVLGYELLKDSGINEDVLHLIKYHHNKDSVAPNINLQILNLADEYSALIEKRPYKDSYSPQKALSIIYAQEVKPGNVNPILFNALVKSVLENKAA